VTYGYRPTQDGAQMESALKLMRAGGARHAVVNNKETGHPEIWRHRSEVAGIAPEKLADKNQ